ncbi:FecR family protein [Roseibium aggregatum]|uniref:FecR family protein n=1 Tax=Roseibium aggregatum TaxID=187304 RepID=A0A939E958_9HYPH|nr:FecR family protein [Roseibium aggregatum]MBN9668885.1 FecR family protein [Roseibium aggregatum]
MAKRRLTHAQRKRHQEAADWVLRNRETELSDEDLRLFHAWLGSDPENRRAYDTAERLLGEARTAIKSDPGLSNFEAQPAGRGKTAAGTLLGLALIAGAFLYLDGPMRLQADVISGVAELPVIELEDGSTIYMNAGSAIAFDYSEQDRNIRLLRGEAFFEVAPDPERPFSVEAGDTQVTALGTAFDIRRGGDETEVTVTHNAVLVELDDPEQTKVRLNEGERIGYSLANGVSDISMKSEAAVLAWRRGLLVLDNEPLSLVVEELERHFSGKIFIAGSSLARRRISGTIAISDTSAALNFLEQALGLSSTKVGPLIILNE